MIARYSRPQMVAIWAAQTRFRIWFEIEAHATDALAELGVVPKEAAAKIWAEGKDAVFDVARIDEIECEVKHDVTVSVVNLYTDEAGNAVRQASFPHALGARNPGGTLTSTATTVLTAGFTAMGAVADDGGTMILNGWRWT